MLLVDHDQSEVPDRGERRRARADANARRAAADPPPLVAALTCGEPRMKQGDPVTEACDKARGHLGRQRNLRNEHDRAPSAAKGRLGSSEVHLGLARPGDAVKQELSLASAVHRRYDGLQGRVLCRR